MGAISGSTVLGLMADYFVKSTIALVLALFAAWVLRRRPAALRHLVLALFLAGLLLIPLLSLAPVGWKTALLPARPAPIRDSAPARPAVQLGQGMAGVSPAVEVSRTVFEEPVRDPLQAAARVAAEPARPADSSAGGGRWGERAIAFLWAAGIAMLLLRLAAGLTEAVRLTVEGRPLTGTAWQALLDRFLAFVALKKLVRLRSHPRVVIPMTWGWRKPVVLLPAGAQDWTEDQRSSALYHELSHIRRADFLVMMLVRTSLAVFWFNPLGWVVYRMLRREQEIACDELVLRAGIRPSTYAANLLAFRRAARFRWNPSAALLGLVGKSPFRERMAAILRQKLTFQEVKMRTKIMLAAAVVLAVALIGTARPAADDGKRPSGTTVVETAVPAPEALAFVPPSAEGQEKQAAAVAQEKEQEKAKEAEKEKAVQKKIVIKSKDGRSAPIEITITEGDKVKKLILEKPLTITSAKEGQVLVLTSDGKEIQVLEGKPLRLQIKAGDVEFIKEGKVLKVGEGGVCKIVGIGDKVREEVAEAIEDAICDKIADQVVVHVTPKIKIIREGEEAKADVQVIIEKEREGGPVITWVPRAGEKAFAVKEFSGKPAFAWTVKEKDLEEKLARIREQLREVKEKKLAIEEVEKSLEELARSLKESEKALRVGTYIAAGEAPKAFTIVRKGEGGEFLVEKGGKAGYTVLMKDEKEGVTLILQANPGKVDKSALEKACARMRKELPEGCALEPEYKEDSGTVSVKVKCPKLEEAKAKALIEKLVEIMKEEFKEPPAK